MIQFSPGVLQSCFEFLELSRKRLLSPEDVNDAFRRIGVTPSGVVLEVSQALNWIRLDAEGCLRLTRSGERLLAIDDLSARMRQAILDYVDCENPIWIQNAVSGRSRLLAFVDVPIEQVFLEAGLVDSEDDETVSFWDSLAARARGQRDTTLVAIGREAERLTLNEEIRRTGRRPKWISIRSNADGYDVLSSVSAVDNQPLSIEVKATKVGTSSSFFLTRNEWHHAKRSPAHIFHLWDVSLTPPRLAVIDPDEMEFHVPRDRGLGKWELAKIEYKCFVSRFREVSSAN